MARAYRMTSARRAAIRKAQLASARKRRGKRKKKIIAGSVAAVGVVGVTMYATKNRRRKSGASSVNVVSETMAASNSQSVSKQLDLIRISPHDAGNNKIDYSEVGKPMRDLNLKKLHLSQRRIDRKLNAHKKGTGKVIAGTKSVIQKVKRNRPGFNDSRRADYKPSQRKAAYEANKEAIKLANKERARRKRTVSLLQQNVLSGISIDSSRFPKSYIPYK